MTHNHKTFEKHQNNCDISEHLSQVLQEVHSFVSNIFIQPFFNLLCQVFVFLFLGRLMSQCFNVFQNAWIVLMILKCFMVVSQSLFMTYVINLHKVNKINCFLLSFYQLMQFSTNNLLQIFLSTNSDIYQLSVYQWIHLPIFCLPKNQSTNFPSTNNPSTNFLFWENFLYQKSGKNFLLPIICLPIFMEPESI